MSNSPNHNKYIKYYQFFVELLLDKVFLYYLYLYIDSIWGIPVTRNKKRPAHVARK